MKKSLLILLFFIAVSSKAQIISSDTALLVELVTTTASQLNELEKLVTNTEKYTERMQKYNELTQDEYFRAERVLYLAESVATKKEVKGLGELNGAIRDLKYSMSDLKELMREYKMIKDEEDKTHAQVKIQKKFNDRKEKIAKSQVNKSIQARTSGRAGQLTAQNTALILESNVDMHNTQLELLEKVSTTNRLLAEQMEEKRKAELEKKAAYGVEGAIK